MDPMPKVTLIGAGSAVFARQLITDILAVDGLDAGVFALGGPTASYALRSATFLGICVAGGIIAAFLVERPALALRDWLCPSRSGALPIGPA